MGRIAPNAVIRLAEALDAIENKTVNEAALTGHPCECPRTLAHLAAADLCLRGLSP